MSVRLGVRIPCVGDPVTSPGVARIAREAESWGVDTIWVNDHLVMPRKIRSRYPFSEDGVAWWTPEAPWYESLTVAAFVAAQTTTVEVGTAVLVLPQRNVLEVAKVIATLHALSEGRFVLGVGAGWLAEEMEALGYSSAKRGRRFEEMIHVLRDCWTGAPTQFDGDEIQVPAGLAMFPRPASPSDIPVMIGGMTSRAIKRAAETGDGWVAFSKGHEVTGSAELAEKLAALDRLRDAAGRGADRFRSVLCLVTPADRKSDLPNAARAAQDMGFDEIAVDPPWDDLKLARQLVLEARRATS